MNSTNGHIEIGVLFESARLKTEIDNTSRIHLDACALCRSKLRWMETAAVLGTEEPAYEPPQTLLDSVLQIGTPSLLKQLGNFIVASLTFDSFSNLAPAGVRTGETGSRQLTYGADDLEIGLSVQPGENRRITITGQVLRKTGCAVEDTSAHVDLIVEGAHIATSSLSSWGEFVFPNVPKAPYSLQVTILDRVLRLPALPIVD